jgi:hypothetical protein
MHNVIQIKRKERGQSMVELALTITFLMALLAGTIDLGRAFFTWLALRDAAQEGASYGTIKPNDVVGVQKRVWDNLEQVVSSPQTNIVVIVNFTGPICYGGTVRIDVNYPNFTIGMPFLGAILGSQTIPIHATVNDTILKPDCP